MLEVSGQRLSVEISTTVQNDMHLKSMPATAEYWKQVGVEAEIQTEEWTQYREDRRADKFVCSMNGWLS